MPGNLFNKKGITGQETASKGKFRTSFGELSDWLNLICLLFALGTAIWSVERAQWVRPSPSFITVFILAVLAGFVLAKSRFPTYLAHVVSLAAAIVVLFCQGLLLVSGTDLSSRTINFVSGVQEWWYSQVNSIPATGTLHIALIFGFLTWIIGYFSIWPLVKKRNPWVAVLLGTVVILVNLNFWRSDKYFYFVIFLVGVLALIAMATYTRYNSRLKRMTQKGINWGIRLWAGSAVCLILIAVSITWISPGFRVAAIADYSRSNTPFKGAFQLFWQNFFATVPGSGSPVLEHGGQHELQLGGALKLNDQVDYIIKSDYLTYWRTQIYDYYETGTWKTRAVDSVVLDPVEALPAKNTASSKDQVSFTVIPQVNTDVIPTTGNVVSGSSAIVEKTFAPMVFEIDIMGPVSFMQLPADIFAVSKSLLSVNLNELHNSRLSWLRSMLPSDLELVDVRWENGFIRFFSIARRQAEIKDEIALTSAKIIEHQKPVTVTVEIPPQFSTDELKSANSNFPLQITDRYLQLPSNYPARVKGLATSIIQSSGTQYDKVQAIINYLKDYPYNLKIEAPPAGADGVDYFLFTQKTGYCTYYASALAVMLRSVGIPARMAVGFLPGQYDPKAHTYIIRDRDYHAWTEVYFQGYGWITFDPTPNARGESADYSIYYIMPSRPDSASQTTTGTSSQSQSTTTDIGRYIGLSGGAIAAIIMLLIIAFCIWIYRQPKSHLDMYSRMILLSTLAGIGPKRWQTALEFSNNLSTAIPRNAKGINRIIQEYAARRYSGQHSEISPQDDLEDSWPIIRNTLIKRWLHIEWLSE